MHKRSTAILRQGDVALAPTSKPRAALTAVPLDAGRVILAYGEVTGHAHQVIADVPVHGGALPYALFTDPATGQRHLHVEAPCSLAHEEHGPIALAPGWYEVIRQREYSPEAIRNVAD
jgi:hypothetical protein